jgi:hypothetical protein
MVMYFAQECEVENHPIKVQQTFPLFRLCLGPRFNSPDSLCMHPADEYSLVNYNSFPDLPLAKGAESKMKVRRQKIPILIPGIFVSR